MRRDPRHVLVALRFQDQGSVAPQAALAELDVTTAPRLPNPDPLVGASAAADALAQRLARPVALPTAEQWEMAARGPDGRRFPWGMNALPAARVDLSPWGLTGMGRGDGEWLGEAAGDGDGLVTGGRRFLTPMRRIPTRIEEVRHYRCAY